MRLTRFTSITTRLLAVFALIALSLEDIAAQTAFGELEGRAAPVARRKCQGGVNAGDLCNENADCPGSTCFDRNVFNLSVAVQFTASTAQLSVLESALEDMSDVLMDVTDGQAEIGQVTIHNNAFSTAADIRIYAPSTGVWWWANTGGWKNGGSIHVSYNYVESSGHPGNVLVHEFTHLVFDARDEYQSATVGCTESLASGTADCPHADAQAAGEAPCIMDASSNSEYCWGHAASSTDISTGNHDWPLETEQSRCRSNRSVWDQVVWSWPNTILEPTGAPDPGANGAALNTPKFIHVDDARRVVLVLDESGSMGSEIPTRLERLQVAARDFVALAEDGTELGIVSYSTDGDPASGHAAVTVTALDSTHRSTCDSAITGLSPSGATNIGDALERAHTMLLDAGTPLPANTYIVLMTDGINNQPLPDPASDLNGQLAALLADGIPVFVTCTGSDWNLGSQCANIASATNGFTVDSADSADLQDSFVYLHEKTRGADPVETKTGTLASQATATFYVEQNAVSVTFTLTWKNAASTVGKAVVKGPDGTEYVMADMPQGKFLRLKDPKSGSWQMIMQEVGSEGDMYTARAYVQSQTAFFGGAANKSVVKQGEAIKLFAYPQYVGSIMNQQREFSAQVLRPDGETEEVVFSDNGRTAKTGDDVAKDGQYTARYANTNEAGVYTFIAQLNSDGWAVDTEGESTEGEPKVEGQGYFTRELRITAAVDEAGALSCTEDTQASVTDQHYPGLTCAEAILKAEADLDNEAYRRVCQKNYNLSKLPSVVNEALVTICRPDTDPEKSGVYVDLDICCPVSDTMTIAPVNFLLLKDKQLKQ
ncbi:MAG: VWA domain-containing protein [Candidatus Electrothrix sp. GW3-4]|uniref:VWA domain-containing protein n=1 Tax=Candidatus Electrothrix sp. GW3-4 TaxID=3126740 RepID=UPI0030CB8A1A